MKYFKNVFWLLPLLMIFAAGCKGDGKGTYESPGPSGEPTVGPVVGPTITPPVDTDADGVSDDEDLCVGTPSGTTVDTTGCEVAGEGPPPESPPEIERPVVPEISGPSALIGDVRSMPIRRWSGVKQFATTMDHTSDGKGIAVDRTGQIDIAGFINLNAYMFAYSTQGDLIHTRSSVDDFGTPRLSPSESKAIALDNDNNIYVAGHVQGYVTRGEGLQTFIAKYDPTMRTVLCKHIFQSRSNSTPASIALGSDGKIYVAGQINAPLESGGTHYGQNDVYVLVVPRSADGCFDLDSKRVVAIGTSQREYAAGIAVADDGNIYVSGSTFGAFPGNTSAGRHDAFLAKVSAAGALEWVKQFGADNDDQAFGVAVYRDNIYVGGRISGSIDGVPAISSGDVFVMKYDKDGNRDPTWTKIIGTGEYDETKAMTVDDRGNVYLAGCSRGNFGGTPPRISAAFLIKYAEAPEEVSWTRSLDTASSDCAQGIATDISGNVYITGVTYGAFPGYSNPSSIKNLFVAKYNVNGVLQ